MIPLRDIIPSRTTPVVTISLIALNVLVFVYELSLGRAVDVFTLYYGLVPAAFSWVNVFTSMFLHGGFMHVAGNMLYLWIFGDNVEDTLGHGRFLLFYLLAGVGAAITQTLSAPRSAVPMIGASGAISAVLGAYVLLFPYATILTLVGFAFFWRFVHIPATAMIGFWVVMQLLFGYLTVSASTRGAESGGVAWFAHIGGFLAGAVLLFLLRPRTNARS
jgi:membrane associated rhomboid family serine protease